MGRIADGSFRFPLQKEEFLHVISEAGRFLARAGLRRHRSPEALVSMALLTQTGSYLQTHREFSDMEVANQNLASAKSEVWTVY